MDPKQNGTPPLDPKLQAAYDRVMGLDVNGTANPTPQPAAPTPSIATPAPSDPLATQSGPTDTSFAQPTQPPTIPTSTTPFSDTTPVVPPVQPAVTPPVPTPSPVGDTAPQTTTVSVSQTPVMQNVNASQPLPQTDEVNQPLPAQTGQTPQMDSLSATIHMPPTTHPIDETIKIGVGGSPVSTAAVKPKKGFSPIILIFGAFAFLVVYAVFWMRFFNYSLPFLGK